MVLTTDAIRARLVDFVAKWSGYDGSEKAGAQRPYHAIADGETAYAPFTHLKKDDPS